MFHRPLLRASLITRQVLQSTKRIDQIRTTIVVTRVNKALLEQKELPKGWTKGHTLIDDHYLYRATYLEAEPEGKIPVLLACNIEGVGMRGDLVSIGQTYARKALLPARLVEYASPENLAKYHKIREEEAGKPRHKSMWASSTIRKLKHMNLPIPMNNAGGWVLNKTHIKVAFRFEGVVITEKSITLPKEEITTSGKITIKVNVNDIESFDVSAIVYPFYSEEEKLILRGPKAPKPVKLPQVWNNPEAPLHVPDDVFNRVDIG